MKNHEHIFFLFIVVFFASCAMNNKLKTIEEDTSSVVYYGADNSGKEDASEAFRNALSSRHIMITVPRGRYIINETIELKKHLRLMPGVVITKTKQGNDGPVFWLSKSYSKLEGLNKRVEIKSERSVPNGILKIGHKDKRVVGKNILYAEVSNLTITGPGTSETSTNIGFHLFNAQAKGDASTTSFFHTIYNVVIQHLDCGILLEGMANANSINNVILNRIGNGTNDTAIQLKGAMENRIFDVFHHYSKNATTLLLENYKDQNGAVIKPCYNYVTQVVSEQGGEYAKCADIRSGYSNSIGVLCNAKGGNVTYDKFEKDKNVMLIN